jgi:adenylate cyclase
METTVPRPENLEIERKFLVDPSYVATLDEGRNIVQGYLVSRGPVSVRVRLVPSADIYMLTVKGPRRDDMRIEEEQQLRKSVAEMLLAACGSRVIEKVRYLVTSDRDLKPWVVDVFHGQNNGLLNSTIPKSPSRFPRGPPRKSPSMSATTTSTWPTIRLRRGDAASLEPWTMEHGG